MKTKQTIETVAIVRDAQQIEAATWRIFSLAGKARINPNDLKTILEWNQSASQRLTAKITSVLEHAVFVFLDESEFSFRMHDEDNSSWIRSGRRQSWEVLVGRSAQSEIETSSLPTRILRLAKSNERAAYEAAKNFRPRRSKIFDDLKVGSSLFSTIRQRATTSSFWNLRSALFLCAGVAICSLPLGAQILAGAVLGMIGASLNEYITHLGIGHASPAFVSGFRRFGIAGLFSEEINLAHRVHHSKILTDFRCEFTDPASQRRLDLYLSQEALKLVESRVAANITPRDQADSETSRIVREIKAGGYGIDGTLAGCIAMNILASPFFVMNFAIYKVFGGFAFLISACFFLSAFVIQSLYSHRYLHLTDEDIAKSKVQGTSTAFMRWYMTTPLARLQTYRHYRHHHEKFDYRSTENGVIMAFGFADYLLRRGPAEAEVHHLAGLYKEGFRPSDSSKSSKRT